MSRLHTYKFNDDLFKKVTTLPGATNHGMVMVLDWSGSMADNLKGHLSQLYNLIWFCRQTQIPFEVYAFLNAIGITYEGIVAIIIDHLKLVILSIYNMKLLNLFSSKMNTKEEMEMMHTL